MSPRRARCSAPPPRSASPSRGPCRRCCAEGRGAGPETAEVVHRRKAVVEAGLVAQLQLPPKQVKPLGGRLAFPRKGLGKVGKFHLLPSYTDSCVSASTTPGICPPKRTETDRDLTLENDVMLSHFSVEARNSPQQSSTCNEHPLSLHIKFGGRFHPP